MPTLTIPKDQTFDLPAGRFLATISSVKQQTKYRKEQLVEEVRVLFTVDIASITKQIPTAGHTFPYTLHKGSELRNLADAVLGPNWMSERSGEEFDLDSLRGQQVELQLEHRHSPKHDRPLVLVAAIFPARPHLAQAA